MKKPHKHAEKIKLWADGYTIQFLNSAGEWEDTSDPGWIDGLKYRVKPPEDPYQHLKEAHARGEKIEYYLGGAEWEHIPNPTWIQPVGFYRVATKKELPPKQPLSMEFFGQNGAIWMHSKAGGRIAMVVEFSEDGVLLGNDDQPVTYHQLMDEPYGWEWSTSPNGPFQPCYT